MPNLPPLIKSPSGSASAVIASAIAKQRSARLHLFQSEIQSRIQPHPRPPRSPLFDGRGKNSAELCPSDDKRSVNLRNHVAVSPTPLKSGFLGDGGKQHLLIDRFDTNMLF